MSRSRILETIGAAIASICLVAASAVALSPAYAADAVVTAEDFEDGSLSADWQQSGGPTLSVVAGNGGQVLQIANRANGYDSIQTAPGVIEADTTYTVSAKVKLADGTAGTPGVRFMANHGSTYDWVGNTTMNSATWTTVSGTYTVPAGAAAPKFYIDSDALAAPYTFLVDDLSITTPVAADTVLTDETFEDDALDPSWQQSGGPTLSVVTANGDKALSVANRGANYDGIQTAPGVVEAAKTYTVSMSVRLADGTVGTPGVRFIANFGSTYDWIGNTTMNADTWTTVTGTYTVAAGAASPKIYVGTDDLTGAYTYLVDDLTLSTPAGGTDPGPDPDPDFVPGGAVNPTTTPVTAAQGSGNTAALTFDDGPNGAATTALLDYLEENDLHATFCLIGDNVSAPGGAALVQRMVADGHMLCNHSTGYADMAGYSMTAAVDDMKETLAAIRTALGNPNAKVPFFRAPNGSWGANLANAAVSLGMQPLGVVNTINDWATQDVPTLEANLRAAIKPGEIVLAHDGGGNRNGTVQAVSTVVSERLDDGWTFTFPEGTPPAGDPGQLSTDFEDGLDGWTARDAGTGSPVIAITTAAAHGGAQAAEVSSRSSQGDGLGHDATGLLVPGDTYHLEAWVKFAGTPVDDVWLSLASTVDGSTTYSTLDQFSGMSSSQWVLVESDFTVTSADSLQLYFETRYQNGDTGNTTTFQVDDISVEVMDDPVIQDLTPIKDTVPFASGVAIDSRETSGSQAELVVKHFDQLTSENFMKPEAWYTPAGDFVTTNAEVDALMDFAVENDLKVYGHTLVWHSQTPAFFFQDASGNPLTNSPADQQILKDRMREHIRNVAEYLTDGWGAFGSATNPVYAFDVVNEVVSDGAENADGLRRSEWFRILGEQFIDLSFEYANDALNEEFADPFADHPVTLFINDYNTEQGGKQTRLKALVERLIDRGVPVDGVGHQFHVSLATPISSLEGAIEAFEGLGLTQAVTELDVTTGTPVSQSKLIDQGYFYRDAYRIFRAHAADLFSVTVWGLNDGRSWRASSGDPLVFNDGLQAKPAYYGIVDDDLPAAQRSANVFAGSVAVDGDATSALEWSQLPLLPIESTGSFQLRWEADHLTAYVSVDDPTNDSTDGIAFTLDGTTYEFDRDGTGDVDGVADETSAGYDVVAHLPLSGAAAGDQLALDVIVSDDGDEYGWNTPGAFGTLTLVEALSYTEIPEATVSPVIDGTVDTVWDEASDVTTTKQVEGSGGATALVHTVWRDNQLYVLAEVTDPIVDVTGSDPWIQDSVEIYVDPGNYKNGSYRYDDSQIRISAANAVSFGTGDEAFQRNRVVSATALTTTGYLVEASISLLEDAGLATFHGVDFQVNDASGGARTSIHNWADPTGAGYQSTARWGVGQLVAGPGTEPTITLNAGSVKAGGTITVDLAGFTEGDTVNLVLDDGETTAAGIGGGGGTLSMAATLRQAITPLGSVVIGPGGTASVTLAIPSSATPGSYTLSATLGGLPLASAALIILAADGSLSAAGLDSIGWMVVGGLLLLLGIAVVVRRRRGSVGVRAH